MTNTFEMCLRYRYMKGCIFYRYLDTDTINTSLLKMYLVYSHRSKLGWFFWFDSIHVTICCKLENV